MKRPNNEPGGYKLNLHRSNPKQGRGLSAIIYCRKCDLRKPDMPQNPIMPEEYVGFFENDDGL